MASASKTPPPPLGFRLAQYVSAFPGGNAAATWDNALAAKPLLGVTVKDSAPTRSSLSPLPQLSTVSGVTATVKHFITHGQEHLRGGSETSHIYSSNIDDKTFHELYLWPLAEAVHLGVVSVMCAYNKINQTQV
ncbi:glycosyl hydrolase family 3 N terminal domain-containing protein [Mycena rebaudengoi]|nr:glycosyl hydrolase family 3 N terminal domain-containing protein [Mycena rebaudengoi]